MDNQELYDAIIEACKKGTVTLDWSDIQGGVRKINISLSSPERGWKLSKDEEEILKALERIGRGIADILALEGKRLYNITFNAEERMIEIWGCDVDYSKELHKWVGYTKFNNEPYLQIDTSNWLGSILCRPNVVDYVSTRNLHVYIGG